jgi:replication-associated recombination protein RarA
VLNDREALSTALASFQTSKLAALTAALEAAVRCGFARSDLHLSSGRHGLVALRTAPKSAAVARACEAAVAGSPIVVHEISAEQGAAHVRNLVQRSGHRRPTHTSLARSARRYPHAHEPPFRVFACQRDGR